jgi:hypothetical protein
MRLLGIVLVIVGIVGLAYGGITYKRDRKVLDAGPFKATVTERKSIPVPPVVGGIALAAGLILLFAGSRRAGRST